MLSTDFRKLLKPNYVAVLFWRMSTRVKTGSYGMVEQFSAELTERRSLVLGNNFQKRAYNKGRFALEFLWEIQSFLPHSSLCWEMRKERQKIINEIRRTFPRLFQKLSPVSYDYECQLLTVFINHQYCSLGEIPTFTCRIWWSPYQKSKSRRFEALQNMKL